MIFISWQKHIKTKNTFQSKITLSKPKPKTSKSAGQKKTLGPSWSCPRQEPRPFGTTPRGGECHWDPGTRQKIVFFGGSLRGLATENLILQHINTWYICLKIHTSLLNLLHIYCFYPLNVGGEHFDKPVLSALSFYVKDPFHLRFWKGGAVEKHRSSGTTGRLAFSWSQLLGYTSHHPEVRVKWLTTIGPIGWFHTSWNGGIFRWNCLVIQSSWSFYVTLLKNSMSHIGWFIPQFFQVNIKRKHHLCLSLLLSLE